MLHTRSEEVFQWLAKGERGISARTILHTITGIECLEEWEGCHPWDLDDFRRCLLLLEQVPELRPHLGDMRAVSDVWARLVDAWDELKALMDQERPQWRQYSWRNGGAPKTAARLKEVLKGHNT